MHRTFSTLIFVLVLAGSAFAQTAPQKIPQGAVLEISVDHPTGAAASGYRYQFDRKQVGSDYAASVWDATTKVAMITSPVVSAPLGLHTIGVTAFDANGETAPAEIQIEVVPPPLGAPTNLRFKVISILVPATGQQ